jgi:hypothetical protein
MTLSERQQVFARNVARLILYMAESNYGCTIGETYQVTGYVKSGTSGDQAYVIRRYNVTQADFTDIGSGTTTGSWVAFSFDYVPISTSTRIYLVKGTSTAGTMLFDEISTVRIS